MISDKEKALFQEMKDSIGTKDPIIFFDAMASILQLLSEKMSLLDEKIKTVTKQTSLGIHWDPAIAAEMMVKEIEKMRQQKDVYSSELSAFKDAYAKGEVTKDYETFVKFWKDTLGWHPLVDMT